MKKRIAALLLMLAALAAVGGASHRAAPAAHATTGNPLIIQFGRMGYVEAAKGGTVDTDCTSTGTSLPDSGGNLATSGTVNLSQVETLLSNRYGPTGTNEWGLGDIALTGVVNTDLISTDVTNLNQPYTQRLCGSHDSSYVAGGGGILGHPWQNGTILAGSIKYASWNDLNVAIGRGGLVQPPPGVGFSLVGTGESAGGQESGTSPYDTNTWTFNNIFANMRDNVDGTGGGDGHSAGCDGCSKPDHSLFGILGTDAGNYGEVAWPSGGVPGCFDPSVHTPSDHACGNSTTCPAPPLNTTDVTNTLCPVWAKNVAGTWQELPADEVARRIAQGCVSGATHTAYDNSGQAYTTQCGSTLPELFDGADAGFNRYYSTGGTNGTAKWNANPARGHCNGASGEAGCDYGLTWSLVGGKCQSTTDSCATTLPTGCSSSCYGGRDTSCSTFANCYQTPAAVETMADNTASHSGEMILQVYRFVTGSNTDSTGKHNWNCTGDVSTHWTQVPETYCYGDFQDILDHLITTDGYVSAAP